MADYSKPWLSLNQQIDQLESRGVHIGGRERCRWLLRAVGYYRLTGYLYPFRESELHTGDDGVERRVIVNHYRPNTSIQAAEALINFDRELRLVLLDAVERIEVSLRMQVGYTLGEVSPFAHRNPANFVSAFTGLRMNAASGEPLPSEHTEWLERVKRQSDKSDEAFVAHFRNNYGNEMPIWVLTEIVELGQLSRLYRGMNSSFATTIAAEYAVPSKKIFASWIASLNYVRNVAAHHARLFNRKLVAAPSRPKIGQVPLLDHLREEQSGKEVFGLYNALAVCAYLLQSIDRSAGWPARVKGLLERFPEETSLTVQSMGAPAGWESRKIWAS